MVVLTEEEFEFVFERLNSLEDVDLIKNRMGLPVDMLLNILGRKIARDATRRFYKIKGTSHMLLKQWKKGESIVDIANSLHFPPVLLAGFILEKMNYNKKHIRSFFLDPSLIHDSRLKSEVIKALEKDFAYSPRASDSQSKNGKSTENKISVWLDSKEIKYITEAESRAMQRKRTPDFLLKKPVMFHGKKVHWFESKASFGDKSEFSKDYKKQLQPYQQQFGPGVVVYWYGYVRDVSKDSGIMIITKEDFKN